MAEKVAVEILDTDANKERANYNGSYSSTDEQELTFRDRLHLVVRPIQSIETRYVEGDGQTHIIIAPEPFRILFYFGFFIFAGIAMFVSTKWGGVNTENNPIKNTFGANNTCIYFDNAPFSLFSATLWMPVILCWLVYTILDYYRAYDSYIDKEITKSFWNMYSGFTYYEIFSIIFSIQFTATTPFENLYLHTIPYLTMTYAFFTLSLKKFLYFAKTGMFDGVSKAWYYVGWCYVVSLLVSVMFKAFLIPPNLFGARMWEKPGLEWTQPFGAVHDKIHFVLVMVCPVLIYLIFTKDCRTIDIVINRAKVKKKE